MQETITKDIILFDEQLERELLGFILINNKNLERIENDTESEILYFEIHQKIYKAIKELLENDRKADINTVYYAIASGSQEDEKLKEYINDLIDWATGSLSTPKEIVETINFLSLKRKLYETSKFIQDAVKITNAIDIESKISNIEEKIYKIANNSIPKHDVKFLTDYAKVLKEKLDVARKSNKEITGLKTNLTDLDRYTGGLQKSDLIIIAARPSMGKTAFAVTIAMNVAKVIYEEAQHTQEEQKKQNGAVAIFSLEMSGEQLSARIIAMDSGFSTKAIHTGRINDEHMVSRKIDDKEFHEIISTCNDISKLPLFIDDTPSLQLNILKSRARYLKKKYNISVIVVDYLQLINASRGGGYGNRVLEIADITQTLKAIAKELDIPVIALSQLSRAVETRDEKRPQLSDLRESGTIEQDADIVMFLYREAYYHERDEKKVLDENDADQVQKRAKWEEKYDKIKNLAEIIIAKNRNGPIGSVTLHFNRELMKFENHISEEDAKTTTKQPKPQAKRVGGVVTDNAIESGSSSSSSGDEIPDDIKNMFKRN
jgi:replicative DNA helicase